MKITVLAVVTTVLLAACLAQAAPAAYPTLAGPSGYGVLPNAGVVPENQLNATLDYRATNANAMEVQTQLVPDVKDAFPIRVLYGANERTEIGVAYNLTKAFGDTANTWSVNAKYRTPFTCCGFAWSTGLLFASTDVKGASERLKTSDLYLVGTRTFTVSPALSNLNGSLGLRWSASETAAPIAASVSLPAPARHWATNSRYPPSSPQSRAGLMPITCMHSQCAFPSPRLSPARWATPMPIPSSR